MQYVDTIVHISGVLTGSCVSWLGLRQAGIIGVVISCMALGISFFADSTTYLAIVLGVGTGMISVLVSVRSEFNFTPILPVWSKPKRAEDLSKVNVMHCYMLPLARNNDRNNVSSNISD